MKAKRIKEGEMANPLYSVNDATKARKSGKDYEVRPFLKMPVGEIVEDRNAWMQCVLGNMVPADDECREKVLRFLGSERRKALIQQVKALRSADGVSRLSKTERQWLEYMEEAYSAELGLKPAPSDIPEIGDPHPIEDPDHD